MTSNSKISIRNRVLAWMRKIYCNSCTKYVGPKDFLLDSD